MIVRASNRLARGGLFLVEVVEHFVSNNCPQLAAALTYYAIFSLPPLLVLTSAGLGFFVDAETARQAIYGSTSSLLSPRLAQNVITLIQDANAFASEGPWWSLLLSLLGVAFGASRGFYQLQTALNRAWGIRPAASSSAVREFLTKRLIAFVMLGATLPAIALSTLLGSLFLQFGREIEPHLPDVLGTLLHAGLGTLASLVLTTGLCTAIYRFLPDAQVTWRQALPGALTAAVAFELIKYAMSFYMNHLELGNVFGQASSLAAVLVWLYVSSNILFLGAQFSQAWSSHHDSVVEPNDGAERDDMALQLELTPQLREWLVSKGFDTAPPAPLKKQLRKVI